VPSPPLPALITGARSSPNPFAPLTRIVFNSGTPGPVRLAVYDAGGVLVRSLARMNDGPGTHAVTWDGRDDRGAEVAAGVYYCRIAAEGEATTVRMVRVR
jgi:flagellar hook assembly protein FlgD